MALGQFSYQALDALQKVRAAANVTPLEGWQKASFSSESTYPLEGKPRFQGAFKGVTLQQLRIFEVVARCGNYTRAAQELYLSQPSVSLHVKQLTQAIGIPLLRQVGKGISVTAIGRELLETYAEVFEKIVQLETRLADLTGMRGGHLQIATSSIINTTLSRFLGPFCQSYPDISVSVHVMNSAQIRQQLLDNTHDLYFLSELPPEPKIYSQPLVESRLVVVAAPGHPLVQTDHIPIADLHGQPMILREPGSATRQAVQSGLEQHQVSVRVKLEVGDDDTIKQMVMHGLGISVLPEQSVIPEVANRQLVVLNVAGFPICRSWYAVYPTGKQLSMVASTFLQYLDREVKS
jgi:LysR family transcriptional regulator, low CO2-responsive transcriptional regulator